MGQSRLNTFLKVVSATVVGISICQSAQAQSGHGHGGHHQSTPSWQFTPNTTSLYANQPFTISGTVGFQNNPTTVGLQSNFNSRSCLATPRRSFYGDNGSGFGVIPGLAIVAPGWAGYPYGGYGYSGYGVGYSGWGTSNYYNRGYYLNNGFNPWINPFPIWGFNGNQNWNGNGFVLNNGFFGAMNEVVERGNARFGPARPVRQQKAQNRNGMQALPMQNQGWVECDRTSTDRGREHRPERPAPATDTSTGSGRSISAGQGGSNGQSDNRANHSAPHSWAASAPSCCR